MSAKERPDIAAFRELETVVRQLGQELASQRKRAMNADAALRELQSAPRGKAISADKAASIEAASAAVAARMSRAEASVKRMLERVRFLRQQLQTPGTGGAR